MKHTALTALLLLLFITAMGQSQSNSWLRLSVEMPLAPKLNSVIEWQSRAQGFENGGLITSPLLHSVRPWLNYKIQENTTLSLSPIAYYYLYPVTISPKDQSKPAQQEWRTTVAVEQRWPLTQRFSLQSRTGLEFRNFSRQQDVIRVRQKFGMDYCLSPQVHVLAYDEVMANLYAGSFFEQNRLGAGVSFQLNKALGVETGYLYINRALPFYQGLLNQHVLYINIRLRFFRRFSAATGGGETLR
ncbi:DUF2490 domain-containing protein [Chitinophaga sp. Cy-1792]|uniref:DUF2490 domain-containing protein n=1 Tax=Chitinophaga sp. Cy-1792 TaxID=2608339 RepID=UPI001422023B|nr:DUF2490 domain-containing protein [Chitinophaga sp. Cy-1792]